MRDRKPIRSLATPVILLALLLVGMMLGGVWHHHARSSDAACQICHLGHQPIDRPLAAHRASAPALVGFAPDASDAILAPAVVYRRVPARAPPIA